MSRAQAGASGRLARGVRALCAFAAIVAALPAGCGGSKVDPFVAELRKLNRVESGSVGYGGSPSDVYAVYEKLSAVASRRELIRLLDDRSPAVRVYAFFALQEKFPETDLFALLKTRLADEEEVETLFGCSGGKRRVADLMLDSIEEGLTEGEREELAAWLLNHPTRLAARGRVLYQPLGPGHHAAVRRLAEAGVPEALPALARFGDEADAALIARHISADSYESLEAVEIFPRAEFFAPLCSLLMTTLPAVAPPLNGQHTVFGRVIRGFDVLAKLQRRNPEDPNPPTPDKIIEAKVLRKQKHDYVPKTRPEK